MVAVATAGYVVGLLFLLWAALDVVKMIRKRKATPHD